MPRTRIAHTIGDWEKLTHVVTPETTAGSPYLEQAHAKLQGFLDEVNRLHVERAEHQARKQAATRRINEVVEEGRRLASNIRRVLKVELGIDNEELTRFGIQPFRGRKRAKKSPDADATGRSRPTSPRNNSVSRGSVTLPTDDGLSRRTAERRREGAWRSPPTMVWLRGRRSVVRGERFPPSIRRSPE